MNRCLAAIAGDPQVIDQWHGPKKDGHRVLAPAAQVAAEARMDSFASLCLPGSSAQKEGKGPLKEPYHANRESVVALDACLQISTGAAGIRHFVAVGSGVPLKAT